MATVTPTRALLDEIQQFDGAAPARTLLTPFRMPQVADIHAWLDRQVAEGHSTVRMEMFNGQDCLGYRVTAALNPEVEPKTIHYGWDRATFAPVGAFYGTTQMAGPGVGAMLEALAVKHATPTIAQAQAFFALDR